MSARRYSALEHDLFLQSGAPCGDSGLLIFDADRRGVALRLAGSDRSGVNGQGLTFANPLRRVLDELKETLAL